MPKKGADTLFALVCWMVWKERNARCFREAAATVQELLSVIRAEAEQWIRAGASRLGDLASGGSLLPTESFTSNVTERSFRLLSG
jgi:hypothetical protein